MPDICNDEKRKAKREYYREWRRNNPERVAQIQERFWQKKAAAIQARVANVAVDPGREHEKKKEE